MKDWNILLVDDEEDFVQTLAERLELRGIECRVALDGEAGLAAMAESQPDVVVLDMFMPGIKGLEVLRLIRERHPKVQVILLTGQGATKDGMDGMKLGAFDYMIKPLSIDDLTSKIGEAVKVARS
ncbi:response regulator [Fundidesulfovibrio agrisoli]|uniref:response regulator n=1 Tax=Fundidesulfovibrio agrisoli TaxID=2922717 RepID=UPI001FAB4100|nr:response regulator [Fundidesulfovibrio agrisoli]